jgi:hypothetical protein
MMNVECKVKNEGDGGVLTETRRGRRGSPRRLNYSKLRRERQATDVRGFARMEEDDARLR